MFYLLTLFQPPPWLLMRPVVNYSLHNADILVNFFLFSLGSFVIVIVCSMPAFDHTLM